MWASAVGLVSDIIGAILLFKYGLPESVNRQGHSFYVLEETDQSEIDKGKRYDRLGRLGLLLLIVGFIFQFIGTFLARATHT